MSVAEAFKDEVDKPDAFCSVPLGMNGFTWIPNCLDWLKKFDTVIVFGDMEKGHMSLLEKITQLVPCKIKAVQAVDYLGEKDANDILTAFGAEAVRTAVLNATEQEISNVKELADVQYVDIKKLPKVSTGIWDLDHALQGGICFGQICLLTGKRGDGKSTSMSQIVADAIDQGIGVFAYSGELPGFHFKQWLNCQLAGESNMQQRQNDVGDTEYYLDSGTDRRISEWYRGKAYIYDSAIVDGEETESLVDTIKKVVSRRNVKLVCIDNLMTAMDMVDDQSNLYLAQSNFVRQLKDIAMGYDVAIILVAHPRKAGKDDKGNDFDNDIVSGSSNITDRVDIVMNYSRDKSGTGGESLLQIGKNRLSGILKLGTDAIQLTYSARDKRVTGTRSLRKRYGWEKQPETVVDIDVPF
jgi:KaiC/GvpD/RAD55 family RecA-like ATPase